MCLSWFQLVTPVVEYLSLLISQINHIDIDSLQLYWKAPSADGPSASHASDATLRDPPRAVTALLYTEGLLALLTPD